MLGEVWQLQEEKEQEVEKQELDDTYGKELQEVGGVEASPQDKETRTVARSKKAKDGNHGGFVKSAASTEPQGLAVNYEANLTEVRPGTVNLNQGWDEELEGLEEVEDQMTSSFWSRGGVAREEAREEVREEQRSNGHDLEGDGDQEEIIENQQIKTEGDTRSVKQNSILTFFHTSTQAQSDEYQEVAAPLKSTAWTGTGPRTPVLDRYHLIPKRPSILT